jgi:hypothetical protein
MHLSCLQERQQQQQQQQESRPSMPGQYALLLSQLQEAQDDLAAANRAMSRSKPKVAAAARQVAAATAVVGESASVLQRLVDTVGLQWPEQQHAVFAAAAQEAQQRLQQGLLQRAEQQAAALAKLQQDLQRDAQQWQQALLPAAQEAVAVMEAVAQDMQQHDSGFAQDAVHAYIERLTGAERQLSQALQALHNSSSSSRGATLCGEELVVSAEVAGRDACATLLELSELLSRASAEVTAAAAAAAAASGPGWQVAEAAEGWRDELAARMAVACRRLQEKEQVGLAAANCSAAGLCWQFILHGEMR